MTILDFIYDGEPLVITRNDRFKVKGTRLFAIEQMIDSSTAAGMASSICSAFFAEFETNPRREQQSVVMLGIRK